MNRLILTAAFAALCVGAAAETTDETLLVPPYPAATPWKNITDKSNALMLMREWIPADQTEADIKDILTEQHFFKGKPITPGDFLKGMFRQINGACASLRVNGPVEHIENGFAVAYAQMYCSRQKGTDKDVDIFLKAIAGTKAFYVVQYEIRRPGDKNRVAGITEFSGDQLEQMKALMARQAGANKYLGDQVKLCAAIDAQGTCAPGPEAAKSATDKPAAPPASDSSVAPKLPNDDIPGPDDVSKSFGWTPGKTTSDDVEGKFGTPTMRNPGPLGHYTYVYQFKGGTMVVCLFNQAKVLIRTKAYQRN